MKPKETTNLLNEQIKLMAACGITYRRPIVLLISTPEVNVRLTVNTVFVDKHCCSSVLMLRLEQSSFICTHCWQFH